MAPCRVIMAQPTTCIRAETSVSRHCSSDLRQSTRPRCRLRAARLKLQPLAILQHRFPRPARRRLRHPPPDRPHSPETVRPELNQVRILMPFVDASDAGPLPAIVVVGTREGRAPQRETATKRTRTKLRTTTNVRNTEEARAIFRVCSCASATSATPRRRSQPGRRELAPAPRSLVYADGVLRRH